MIRTAGSVGIMMLSMVACATVSAYDSELTAQLRQVVENNLAAYNREDLSATMQSIHTKSPEYTSMQQVMRNLFSDLDAQTELISFRYIGHDDEFAVARVKLKTVEASGNPFTANILDTITIFHQEDGIWKYWSDHVLGVEIVR